MGILTKKGLKYAFSINKFKMFLAKVALQTPLAIKPVRFK
jgi:hypothetical protein